MSMEECGKQNKLISFDQSHLKPALHPAQTLIASPSYPHYILLGFGQPTPMASLKFMNINQSLLFLQV